MTDRRPAEAVEPAADLVCDVVGREVAALRVHDPEMTRGGAR